MISGVDYDDDKEQRLWYMALHVQRLHVDADWGGFWVRCEWHTSTDLVVMPQLPF